MLDMRTVKEIRYENLLKLVSEFGGGDLTAALATTKSWHLADSENKLSRATLDQILKKVKTANDTVRGVGDSLARKIESEFRLTGGWMDVDHQESTPAAASATNAIPPEQLIELIALFGEASQKGRELIMSSARNAPKASVVSRKFAANDQT